MRVLVEHLPPHGALARAVHGHAWTDDTYLLANVVDGLGALLALTANVNRGKGSRPVPYPEPVPRPGDSTEEDQQAAEEVSRRRHAAIRARMLQGGERG